MDELILPPELAPSNVILFPDLKRANDLGIQPKSPVQFDGILSGPMWTKANDVPSQYPDTFDYGMYDRLHAKFGDKQPRGGVVYNTNFKLLNYQPTCSQCHYTFELDTYGRGCVHNCTYCYAKDQLSPYGYWNKPHPFP